MGIVFTLIMMSLGDNNWPEKLDLKNTKIYCSDIVALNMKEDYRYIGIRTLRENYMTGYTNPDKLQSEIDRQCKRKK